MIELFASCETTAKGGCPAFAVETMLRIHFVQQWFGLSDPAMGEALHDTSLYCEFARPDPGAMRLPNETTILRFRHLLEENQFEHSVALPPSTPHWPPGACCSKQQLWSMPPSLLHRAPPRTALASVTQRCNRAKKGNQWHFGIKAHIGVDAESGLLHSVIKTAANANDVTQGYDLLQGHE